MIFFRKNFSYITFLLIVIIGCSSCKKHINPNAAFNEKYGQEIKAKFPPKKGHRKEVKIKDLPRDSFEPVTQQEVFLDNIKRQVQYYPYYDVNKFGQSLEGGYSNNYESVQQSNFQGQEIPPDIFDVVYEPRNYKTFNYQGARFDEVKIPNKDKYGVYTSLSRKEYLMSGNNALQNSLDLVEKNKTEEDIKNSKIIIKEQKDLRQKQNMINIFGYDAVMMREKIDNAKKQKDLEVLKAKEAEALKAKEEADKAIKDKEKELEDSATENLEEATSQEQKQEIIDKQEEKL